jgi:hypothetical protein
MRLWLIISMIITWALVLAIMVVLFVLLRRFQRHVPELRNADDLARFKKLAAVQMYGSLPGVYMPALPICIWAVGKFALGQLGWVDALAYVVIPFLILGFVSSKMIGTAVAVRETAVADSALRVERDHVVDVWLHRHFPDW